MIGTVFVMRLPMLRTGGAIVVHMGQRTHEAPPLFRVQSLRPSPLHPDSEKQKKGIEGVGLGVYRMPEEINKRLCLHPVQTGVITAKGPRWLCLRCKAYVKSAIATGRDTNIFDD